MPTYYDEYESTTRHGYGADPRGLGAAASCYAPPMGQRVNLYGRQYFPVVKRAGERVLVFCDGRPIVLSVTSVTTT